MFVPAEAELGEEDVTERAQPAGGPLRLRRALEDQGAQGIEPGEVGGGVEARVLLGRDGQRRLVERHLRAIDERLEARAGGALELHRAW